MKKLWKIAAITTAVVFVGSAAVGVAEASTSEEMKTVRTHYDKCSPDSVCLYQHGNGTGSKKILSGPLGSTWNLTDVSFFNGRNCNDQVSSVYNNQTSLWAWLSVDIDGEGTAFITIPPGGKVDFSVGTPYQNFNDRISSVELVKSPN